jgi:hypothetical protein
MPDSWHSGVTFSFGDRPRIAIREDASINRTAVARMQERHPIWTASWSNDGR